LARLSGLPVMCGCMIGSGLEHSANIHLWVANQWASQFLNESTGPMCIHGTWDSKRVKPGADIALNMPRFKGGLAWPNEGPGFGIDLNEEFLVTNHTKGKYSRTVSL
jgi:L-alanine-DL-glutamate epimerase-like enolase superfamily enzyme